MNKNFQKTTIISFITLAIGLLFAGLPLIQAESNIPLFVFNETGEFIGLQDIEGPINVEGIVVNAYYVDNDTVKLIASSYVDNPPVSNVTFYVKDAYTDNATSVLLSVPGETEVNVWSNTTLVAIKIYDQLFGPYVLRHYPIVTTPPPNLRHVFMFIPLAVFFAFAARGNPLEAGLGFIAYSFLGPIVAYAYGVFSKNILAASAFAFFVGLLIVMLSYEKKGQGGS